MACKHEQIKCVNCVKSCLICGEILPEDFKPGKSKPKADTPAKQPKNAVKTDGKEQTVKKGDAK